MSDPLFREELSQDGRTLTLYRDEPDGMVIGMQCTVPTGWQSLGDSGQERVRRWMERKLERKARERFCGLWGHELDKYGWHCEYCGTVVDESKIPLR